MYVACIRLLVKNRREILRALARVVIQIHLTSILSILQECGYHLQKESIIHTSKQWSGRVKKLYLAQNGKMLGPSLFAIKSALVRSNQVHVLLAS